MRVLVLTPWHSDPVELDLSPAVSVRDAVAFIVGELGEGYSPGFVLRDADEQQSFPESVSLAQCDVCDGDILELVRERGKP